MFIPSNEEARKQETDGIEVLIGAFLSPGPINIIREIGKRGKVQKSELLEKKGSGIHWPTYSKYEKALIASGLIKIEEEPVFPFRQTVEVTQKGKKVLELLEEIESLVSAPTDQ